MTVYPRYDEVEVEALEFTKLKEYPLGTGAETAAKSKYWKFSKFATVSGLGDINTLFWKSCGLLTGLLGRYQRVEWHMYRLACGQLGEGDFLQQNRQRS